MRDELKETIRAITPRFLLFYIVGSIIFSIIIGFNSFSNFSGGFGPALTAIDLSSSMFVLGAPFVMGASLLLPSFRSSKDKIPESDEDLNARFLTISRFVVLLVITTAFTISWILMSYSLAIQDSPDISPDLVLAYLPGTLLSGLIMTIILSAVTTFVATILDDWKIALVANLVLFFILWFAFGATTRLDAYDSLTLFGPYHLYRFLSVAASGNVVDPVYGIVWENPTTMAGLMGITFGFADILISGGLWITISMVLLLITQYPMRQNINRLRMERDLARSVPADQKLLERMKTSTQFLRQRRQALGTVLVIMLVVLPLLQFSVQVAIEEEATQTLYESPTNGETLALGSWVYGEVVIAPPPAGLHNMYQLRVEILDWGGCPPELDQYSKVRELSLADFEALNDTEKEDLISLIYHITPDRTVMGTGYFSIHTTGTHVWACKFMPAEGYLLQGIMRIRISLTIRAS
ncbi:MAG: hypothetical protein ACTSV2_04870 [Candidatus Thorarchaeota archaeon]